MVAAVPASGLAHPQVFCGPDTELPERAGLCACWPRTLEGPRAPATRGREDTHWVRGRPGAWTHSGPPAQALGKSWLLLNKLRGLFCL